MHTQTFSFSRTVSGAAVLAGVLLGLANLGAAGQSAPAKAAKTAKPPSAAKSPAPPKTAQPATNVPSQGRQPPNHPQAKEDRGKSPSNGQPTDPGKKPKVEPRGGFKTITTPKGAKVTTDSKGRIRDVDDPKRNMHIHHDLGEGRRIEAKRPDGSRLVAERGRRGFVERPYRFHDHDFARRSYYYHGARYDRFYNHYYDPNRGVYLDVYAPAVYYPPAFYGWAYNPWAAPVAYGWGWAGNPWLGFYAGYFTPWAAYPSAAFWLTDYLIAQDLQAAYAAQGGLASQGSIAVAPAQPWTDSGSQMVQGQLYIIAATGMLQFNANPGSLSPPNGRTGGPQVGAECASGLFHAGFLAPQLPCVSLIAKIGPDGAPFEVGGLKTFVAPTSGELFLGVNDCISCFGDNSGGWIATVTSAAPAPGNQASATQAAAGLTPLSPEVKQLIAEEVKNQLALEYAEAAQTAKNQDVEPDSSGIDRILDDVTHGKPHMFVAGGSLDVTASSGQECHIGDGDALQLVTPPAANATTADLVVRASKGGVECAPGTTVTVNLTDLQEMQNHMRENIDMGLKELQTKQGHGLPPAPAPAQAPPAPPQYAALAPPPNPQDEADIQAQARQADQAEAEAQSNR